MVRRFADAGAPQLGLLRSAVRPLPLTLLADAAAERGLRMAYSPLLEGTRV